MERVALLSEVCPAAVYLFDCQRQAFLWLSPQVSDLLGYSAGQICDMGSGVLSLLVNPADLPYLLSHYESIRKLEGETTLVYECRFTSREGEYRVLSCRERVYRRSAAGYPLVTVGIMSDVTRERQSEDRLRLKANLLDAVQQAVIVTDLDGRVSYWNRYAETLYGYTSRQAVGKPIFDLTVATGNNASAAGILSEVGRSNVWRGIFPVKHRDGHTFPARVTDSALYDENGRAVGFIGISEDMTAELAAQQAREESERRLELIAKATKDALWEWDPATGYVWRNEGFERLAGQPPASDLEWWSSRLHPEDRERVVTHVEQSLPQASGYTLQYRFRRADGDYATVLDRAYIDRHADGSVRRVVGAMTDLTALVRAERALQEQEEHSRRIFEECPLGIALVSPDGRVVRVNPRLAEMLGYTARQLEGMSFHALTHPDDIEAELARMQHLFAEGTPRYKSEKRCFRRDGSTAWMSTTCTPLRSQEGEIVWVLCLVEDITQRHEVEDQLRQARERAEAASAAKSVFLAHMSHEIRTPMSGLLGMLELLQASGLNDEQGRLLEAARQAGASLVRIINDILDLTKVQHGRLSIQSAPFSLRQLLAELDSLYRPQAEGKRIAFDTRLDPDLAPWLYGDAGRLRQILMNLLSNALRFTASGSVELAVLRSPADPSLVHFRVSDSGTGIPERALPGIFEAFSELSAETSRSMGGTGLGLAIVKQLVSLMGGEIHVDSKLGVGSRFWFELPLAQAEPPVGSPHPLSEAKSFAGRRVLLVEDNLINQHVGKALLSGMGLEVEVAASGVEAIACYQQKRYDLVLMDCNMPLMDGFEAARRIRAMETHGTRVPIIALTALAFDEDRQRCMDAGMDDFLAKPVEPADLQRVLRQWLR